MTHLPFADDRFATSTMTAVAVARQRIQPRSSSVLFDNVEATKANTEEIVALLRRDGAGAQGEAGTASST